MVGCPRECANMGCFTNQYLTMTAEKQTRRGLISQVTEGMLLDELSAFKVTAGAEGCNVEEGKQTGHGG